MEVEADGRGRHRGPNRSGNEKASSMGGLPQAGNDSPAQGTLRISSSPFSDERDAR
jgi:hypothetical protein